MMYSLYESVNHLIFGAEVGVRRAWDARGPDSAAFFPVPVVRFLVVSSSSGWAAATTPPTGRWTSPVVVGLSGNPVVGPDGRRDPRVPTASRAGGCGRSPKPRRCVSGVGAKAPGADRGEPVAGTQVAGPGHSNPLHRVMGHTGGVGGNLGLQGYGLVSGNGDRVAVTDGRPTRGDGPLSRTQQCALSGQAGDKMGRMPVDSPAGR